MPGDQRLAYFGPAGTNTEVAVNIKSVTFPNNRTALVRFSTDEKSRGTVLAYTVAYRYEKPSVVVKVHPDDLNPAKVDPRRPKVMAKWLKNHEVKTLNVAGNRESGAPGIGEFVEEYLSEVFRLLKSGEAD